MSARQWEAPTARRASPGVLNCWDVHGELGIEKGDKLVRPRLALPGLGQPIFLAGEILARWVGTALLSSPGSREARCYSL